MQKMKTAHHLRHGFFRKWCEALCLAAGAVCISRPVFSQEMDDIRDIRPPVDYPVNWLFWIILAGAALLGLLVWMLRRRIIFPRKQQTVVPPDPPWVTARQALARLKGQSYPEQGRIREYYFELSYILRRYIEDRFAVKAPEMTTEEFLESLKNSRVLNDSQKKELQYFLTGCDMVKFAKYSAGRDDMEASFNLTEKFIDETVPAGGDGKPGQAAA
jgi:hypothetical protein